MLNRHTVLCIDGCCVVYHSGLYSASGITTYCIPIAIKFRIQMKETSPVQSLRFSTTPSPPFDCFFPEFSHPPNHPRNDTNHARLDYQLGHSTAAISFSSTFSRSISFAGLAPSRCRMPHFPSQAPCVSLSTCNGSLSPCVSARTRLLCPGMTPMTFLFSALFSVVSPETRVCWVGLPVWWDGSYKNPAFPPSPGACSLFSLFFSFFSPILSIPVIVLSPYSLIG